MKKLYLLTIILWAFFSGPLSAQLPQDYQYQRTIRDYLGSLNQQDFEVDLEPLTVNPSYFSSMDEVYRTWLFFEDLMGTRGLRVNASHFTLDAIEEGGRVNMTVGKKQFMNALATAAWSEWDYEGNPHYGSRAIKLRAFVASAIDMMMQDQDHERGNNRRSDFTGLQITQWAYVYGVSKNELPQSVRDAYEKGLIRMFKKIEQWGPTGTHADIDMATMPAVLYVAEFVDSEDLTDRAYQYIDRLLGGYYSDAGYIDHGSAYDAGYNGISMYFINWAAQISNYQPLVNVIQEMSKLKAYLTLPDPDGHRFSPFHSNPSSGTDAPNDLWGSYDRDVGAAKYADDAVYLALKGGSKDIHSQQWMLNDIENKLQYINRANDQGRFKLLYPSKDSPEKWNNGHWLDSNSINATAFYYKNGLYDRLKDLKTNNSKFTKAPFKRSGEFTENFGNKFLSVKRSTYGTIIFNDRLSWWTGEGKTHKLNGFGGGNLSAFWTPETGSVLLGGSRGTHNTGHDLDEWREWPVHALSGETPDGRAFSSGLQRHPKAEYRLNQNSQEVTVTGDLTNIHSDPRDGLQGKSDYTRIFKIKDNGVEVTTTVDGDGGNQVKELYEVLPVYRRNAYHQKYATPTTIEFKVNGNWQQAGTSFKEVTSIRLKRFGGTVLIDFEKPARVKLSPQEFYKNPDTKNGLQTRNIMIDLLGSSSSLSSQSVRYFMRSSNAQENDWSESSNENPKTDTTPPEIETSLNPSNPESGEEIQIAVEASDISGIQQIGIFAEGETVKTCSDARNCTAAIGPFNDGTYIYYITATDKEGNTKTSSEKQFVVETVKPEDITPPQIVELYHNHNQPDNSQEFGLHVKAKDAGGIAKIDLYFEDEKIKTCTGAENCSVNVGPYQDGSYQYHAKVVDTGGNETTSEKRKVTVFTEDRTPPEVAVSHSPDNPDEGQKITLKAEASDMASISQIEIFVDDKKVKTCSDAESCNITLGPYSKGTYRYHATATDKNGNKTTTAQKQVAIEIEELEDTTAPEIEVRHTPSNPDNSDQVGIIVEASDAGGIGQIAIFAGGKLVRTCTAIGNCSIELGPYKDGNYSYYATATDNNGNKKTSSQKQFTVKTEPKDTTPPEVSLSHTPDNPDNSRQITIHATAEDVAGIDGIALFVEDEKVKTCSETTNCSATVGPFSDGTYSYHAVAIDNNGNKKTSAKKQIAVRSNTTQEDTDAPELTVSHTPDQPDDSQTVTITAEADDVSGIGQITVFLDGEKVKTCTGTEQCSVEKGPYNDGRYVYYATATDKKGNKVTSDEKSLVVNTEVQEDTDAPAVTITHSPRQPYENEIVTFTAQSGDDSGIKSIKIYVDDQLAKSCTNISECTFKKDSFTAGSHSYYATATDNSVNANKASSETQSLNVLEEPASNTPPATVNVTLETREKFLETKVDGVDDPDGDKVNLNYDWRLNGKSIAVINYPFDVQSDPQQKEKVTDHTSDKNDGLTGVGEAAPAWTTQGKIGGALGFDGDSDFITVPSNQSLEKLENFTIETWINHDNWGDEWASIISKPFSNEKWETPWSVFKLSRNAGKDNLNFQITVGDNEAVSLQSNENIPSNEWTHVVGTYDGTYLRLYINGRLDKELEVDKPLVANAGTDLFIGKKSDTDTNNPEHFKGRLDELRVYNKALTLNQVKEHHIGNYRRLSLDLTQAEQRWEVAVTANDSKTRTKTTTSNTVITVLNEGEAKSGNRISISQNYPNPFRSSTTIEMNLEEQETMTVKIYDSLGRLVQTVFEGDMPSGTQTMKVDGNNLSSGIYFCRFSMESEVITKKMTLIK